MKYLRIIVRTLLMILVILWLVSIVYIAIFPPKFSVLSSSYDDYTQAIASNSFSLNEKAIRSSVYQKMVSGIENTRKYCDPINQNILVTTKYSDHIMIQCEVWKEKQTEMILKFSNYKSDGTRNYIYQIQRK